MLMDHNGECFSSIEMKRAPCESKEIWSIIVNVLRNQKDHPFTIILKDDE